MSATNSTNLVIPENMKTEINVEFAKIFDFLFGGMASRDPNVGPGELVNIRGFNELAGTAKRMIDGGTYAVNNIDSYKDIGVILHRIEKFGAEDLGAIISGQDPTGAIKSMISRYFARNSAARILDVLKGVFATSGPLVTANKTDVFVDDATVANQVFLTPGIAAPAAAKIGDNMFDLGVWLMHSATAAKLLASGYLETSPNGLAYEIDGMEVKRFMGKPVLVSDTIGTTAGANATKYRTYLAAKGALFLGTQKEINPEYSRDSNKIDIISTDYHFCPHVRGCKWIGTTNPEDSSLILGTNWALAYSDTKQVRVIAIDHNA